MIEKSAPVLEQRRNSSYGSAARASRESDTDEFLIDIRAVFLMLWRRKYIIFSVVLLVVCLTIVAMSFVQERYKARSLVLIQGQVDSNQVPKDLQLLVNNVRLNSTIVLNEIEVLRSRTMAKKVIERLGLLQDLRTQDDKMQDGNLSLSANDKFKSLNVSSKDLSSIPNAEMNYQIERLVSQFLKNLEIRAVPGSYAIQIEYASADRHQAARVANTVADLYIESRLKNKFKATRKLTEWLDERLTELREQVRNAEIAVAEYRAQNNLTEGRSSAVSVEQLTQINAQLITAKAKRAESRARLDQFQSLAKDPKSVETALEVMNSSLVQGLKSQETSVLGTLSDLSERYGEKHPQIIKVRAELGNVRAQMREEMQKIAKSIENELRIAEARVTSLEEGMESIKDVRNQENAKMVRLNELQREADSSRIIFDRFMDKYKSSDEQEKLQEADAQVISYAVIPAKPYYPDKPLFLSLAMAFSLFLGIAVSFLLEKLDNTFRSAGQLENATGLPCYALIPAVENMNQQQLVKHVLNKPSSTVAEAVRTLRTVLNLRASRNGEKPKVVTITSSFPGEGKTTLSCWLARLAAKSGDKVILIDGDLRRPNVHRSLQANNDVSLVEYLTGKNTLEETIQTSDPSGLHVITGKSVPNSALDLVSSAKMKKLVESLKQVYDLVILDSPACLAVSDARILASLSDYTIYSVAWDKTPREVILGGVKQFSDMGYEDMAFILTNVDIKRHVRYGYGDMVYYYGNYRPE